VVLVSSLIFLKQKRDISVGCFITIIMVDFPFFKSILNARAYGA
jgi:hypothetical protein